MSSRAHMGRLSLALLVCCSLCAAASSGSPASVARKHATPLLKPNQGEQK